MSASYKSVSSAGSRTIQTSRLVTLILVILLNLNLSVRLHAQQNDIKFECISLEQGLSQSTVLSIIQDRQGFMWFATQSGLNRYDGYNFTVYNHDPFDSTSLSGIIISDLFEDHSGDLGIRDLAVLDGRFYQLIELQGRSLKRLDEVGPV